MILHFSSQFSALIFKQTVKQLLKFKLQCSGPFYLVSVIWHKLVNAFMTDPFFRFPEIPHHQLPLYSESAQKH